ncbi:MAG: U32 family peptidase [Desulfobacterales bacterium]|jgi:putative protease|nr:U32 family peptidase [Desulfobacterales bacterium]
MNNHEPAIPSRPLILAPAGDRTAFLAALAAGADEIYCGLRHFSARMAAENFTIEELVPLTLLAHDKGVGVHVALNTLLKPDELHTAARLLQQLNSHVKPDGIIIQDLAFVDLACQIGFKGEIHLSTLSNVSFPAALEQIQNSFGVRRVVLPRELNIDEVKAMAMACPKGLDLEIFIHGALCYGVSGRCYWSSYLGGKSGLRGRCVQPCRRVYRQKDRNNRFFSCWDLSLDVLVKVLMKIPQIRTWKIEGRKKGPHTVFYTIKAYRMLRDHGADPKVKKEALELLSYTLGRSGTHYHFLPQRPQNPIHLDSRTGSGLFVGTVKGTAQQPFLNPKEMLLPGDLIRIGYEDEKWHRTVRMARYIPKGGRLVLKPLWKKNGAKNIPVFLIDRREKDLMDKITRLEKNLIQTPVLPPSRSVFTEQHSKRFEKKKKITNLIVFRQPGNIKPYDTTGLWLSKQSAAKLPKKLRSRIWWWLPPVIWPENEKEFTEIIDLLQNTGARHFVLNAPWQHALFKDVKKIILWAGPFCNIANASAIRILVSMGFKGAIVTPELGQKDYLMLPGQSPLPLGVILYGSWPLCVSRVLSDRLETGMLFTSPKGEAAWATKIESDYWVYPNWRLDLNAHRKTLEKQGYRLFVNLMEPIPKNVSLKKRPGLWNWEVGLL